MTHTTSGYLELGDGKIYYETAGAGDPVVFCHAGFVDSGMWDGQWAAFSERYRVVRFDLRGYGRSDLPDGPISRRADLLQLLEHLAIGQATLVGCSLGGEIALDLALERPDIVAALILVSTVPSGFALQGEPPRYLLEMMGAIGAGDRERAAELQTRIWIDGSFREPAQVDQQVRQRALAMSRVPLAHNTLMAIDSQPLSPLEPPAADRLAAVGAPTLIVVGALDDQEIQRAAGVMEAAIPHASQTIIPSCAHMPPMERPADFNRAALEFLALRQRARG
ncbi:MAG: alpha/beta hydrolase [Herpetosiphonaceae bacterium]|nr:alpha/beta hydrolase [Herpetosiphonaceae bacterium]